MAQAILRITSRRAGFRRAGIAHPAEPTDHPVERFTVAQLEALQAEPMLTVQWIELPDTEAEKAAAEKAAAEAAAEAAASKAGKQKGGGKP